jgi:hypothetical protein
MPIQHTARNLQHFLHDRSTPNIHIVNFEAWLRNPPTVRDQPVLYSLL